MSCSVQRLLLLLPRNLFLLSKALQSHLFTTLYMILINHLSNVLHIAGQVNNIVELLLRTSPILTNRYDLHHRGIEAS